MGMGMVGCRAVAVEESFIDELCPVEWCVFTDTLERYGLTLEHAAKCFMWEDPELGELTDSLDISRTDEEDEACLEEVPAAWAMLQIAFSQATTAGDSKLELIISYHDSEENGDRYDEVDGVFFQVDGAYQLSPAGAKFKGKFADKSFVEFC